MKKKASVKWEKHKGKEGRDRIVYFMIDRLTYLAGTQVTSPALAAPSDFAAPAQPVASG